MINLMLKILITYLIIFFILPAILLPNNLLIKTKTQKTKKLKKVAERLKGRTKGQTLKNVFNYVTKTYSVERYKFLFLPRLVQYNIEKLIDKKIFLPCYAQNFVLKTLLINTGQFKEKDIKGKGTFAVIDLGERRIIKYIPLAIIHQYLLININKKIFRVDPFRRVFRRIK